MLEFIILMTILTILSKSPAGVPIRDEEFNPYDNNSADAYIKNNSWEFETIEDALEFRDLRQTGFLQMEGGRQ